MWRIIYEHMTKSSKTFVGSNFGWLIRNIWSNKTESDSKWFSICISYLVSSYESLKKETKFFCHEYSKSFFLTIMRSLTRNGLIKKAAKTNVMVALPLWFKLAPLGRWHKSVFKSQAAVENWTRISRIWHNTSIIFIS